MATGAEVISPERRSLRQGWDAWLPRAGLVAGFFILFVAIIFLAGRMTPLAQGLGAISIIVLFCHSVVALGWTEAVGFALICLVVTFSVENLGALTGFPFGRYAFLVDADLPHIGVIPLIVGPLYFGMGYPSWIIANLLLGARIDRPVNIFEMFAIPVIAAFVMVQWDVVMDPSGSTLAKAWVWYGSGGYFGVPLSNFLGWLLVTYLYFQAFSFVLHRRRAAPPYRVRPAAFWAAPILLYLAAGLSHIPLLLDPPAQLVDAGGRSWEAADLQETAVIVMLFTMLPTSLLALLRLARSSRGG